MLLNKLCKEAAENSTRHGFWEMNTNIPEKLCLMHSEISEALEEYRNHIPVTQIRYEEDKPCGIPIELADVLIRVFDFCGHFGIDLDRAVEIKMLYNLSRPYMHGKNS